MIAGSRAALPPSIELRADFKNGGFTLILPPLDDRYLFNLTEMFDEQDDMSGFISSDPKVRVFGLNEEDFYAFNLTGSPIGTVFYGKDVEYWRVGTVRGGLIYADRAVTITGVNKQAKGTDDHHDLKLKKGWNRTARTKLADVGNRDQYMISTTFAASELNWKIVQE